MHDLDAIVIGGGIGGLTTAAALRRDGHRVRVIDQVRELRPIGAGISLWSNGVKVLDTLGLGREIAAVGGSMERMAYADQAGRPLCDFSLAPLVEQVGERPYPVRRADLQALLLGAVGDRLTLGRRCLRIDQDADGVVVHTEGGDVLEGDLAVVADGTHSRLREDVVGHPVERRYVGYHNWNGIVPDEASLADAPTTWAMQVGDGRRVSTMPVRDGQYFFFDVPMADPTPDPTDPQGTLRSHFAGWGERVQRLIDAIVPSGVATVSIHTHDPVDTFARGRVALLGDAAHTTAPDLGQGGCLAMEDALVLSHHLTTTSLGVADALARYSAERVPRARDVMEKALVRARLSHGHDPARTARWYEELAGEDGGRIVEGIGRTILAGPCR